MLGLSCRLEIGCILRKLLPIVLLKTEAPLTPLTLPRGDLGRVFAEGVKPDEIAAKLGINRASVFRMLKATTASRMVKSSASVQTCELQGGLDPKYHLIPEPRQYWSTGHLLLEVAP